MAEKKQARYLGRLSRLYRKLDKKGGPEADGELFEKILGLEEDILALSGLTATESNTAILAKLRDYDDTKAGVTFVQLLLHLAESHSGRENYAPLELLASAIASHESPFEVLPRMGLLTHEYTIYLYELLLKEPSIIIEVYNEMMRTRELLEPISLLKQRYEELKGMNVRFLERFLQSTLEVDPEPPRTAEAIRESSGGYVAQVAHIVQTDNPEEYSVRLVVNSQQEIALLQEAIAQGSEQPIIHSYVYDMVVSVSTEGNSMTPDDELEACMEVLHEYEYDDNLNPTLRRKWKTAYLADNITERIFSSGLLEVWDSEKQY
jgi:hypothetical protein